MPRSANNTPSSRVISSAKAGADKADAQHKGLNSLGDLQNQAPKSILASTSTESSMHPNLGLHSASASGNVGLVKFALDNGQPHNSILNGLLPLHAACSGGNEAVVRLLLSYGADINASRQKVSKGSSSNIGTGSEGSTPLHFAAANGHTTIVRILLESGARPNEKDKEGNVPEMLALAQNHLTVATILRNFVNTHGSQGLADLSRLCPVTTSQDTSPDRGLPAPISPLRAQRSMESLSSAAAGVKATLKHHKKQALAKVSSNPNLKSFASFGTSASPPPPLPTGRTNRNGIDTTRLNSSAHTTPPSSISSTNILGQQLRDSSKRRPSLPSIFERPAPPASSYKSGLLANPTIALSHPAESVEDEVSSEKHRETTPTQSLSLTSPSRLAIRLPSKKSLTGLFGKASGSNSESISPTDQRSKIDITESNPGSTNTSNTSASNFSTRSRSGSSDLLGQPTLTQPYRADGSGSTSFTSLNTSVDNADGISKFSGPALYPFRPRKSSNLTTTSSPMLHEEEGDQATEKPVSSGGARSSDGGSAFRHGRKRSQSATSVPKRPATSGNDNDFARQIGRIYGSHFDQLSSPLIDDDSKEILDLDHLFNLGRSKTPTRLGHQRAANVGSSPRITRSPLLSSSKVLTDASLTSSPTLGQRALQTQPSSSSLVSSTSSNRLISHKTSRVNLDPTAALVDTIAGDEASVLSAPNNANRSHRSASQSEMSMASKASSTSLRSFAGLTAQEQAQAILRTADESNIEGGAINLSQMLASYGEALAQERGSSKSIASIRKQMSTVSLNSLASQNTNRDDKYNDRLVWESPTLVKQPGTDYRMPSMSRSSSLLPNQVDGDAKVKRINYADHSSNKSPIHASSNSEMPDGKSNVKQSPSLPNDLSRFATPTMDAKEVTDTTPTSKIKNQHRSTISDPHSPLLDKSKTDEFKMPSMVHQVQKMASINDFKVAPLQVQDSGMSSPNSETRQSPGEADKVSPSKSGKRKGAVKAFLSGIKSNVVK